MKSKTDVNKLNKDQPFIDPLIHAPARFQIISNLYLIGVADFLFLRNVTGLTKGNLSSHLTKLEQVEYVEIKKEFVDKISRTTISLSETGRKAFNLYRKNLKNMLDDIPD
jgi:DNA-binding MarR family transcriptional regulator